MSRLPRHAAVLLLGVIALVTLAARVGAPVARADSKSIEQAVLAVSAEMTRAGEAVDADRLFGHMLETDKGSVIQDGLVSATRQEALERVRANLRGIRAIQYRWTRQYVTVLSPEIALLVAEGESTVTTDTGATFGTPFAQTIVFVLRDGRWRAIHAHQSAPRSR